MKPGSDEYIEITRKFKKAMSSQREMGESLQHSESRVDDVCMGLSMGWLIVVGSDRDENDAIEILALAKGMPVSQMADIYNLINKP